MKNSEFVAKAIDIADNYKTLYVMGCFGAPLTPLNKLRYTNNHNYNKSEDRVAMISSASNDTFGFDCVCLIKGIVWGWRGDVSHVYGGAKYKVNGCPDYSADQMINYCDNVSTIFNDDIPVGAALWCPGHIGIYIGNGLAVECTPRWTNNAQKTAVGNLGHKPGYNIRTWTKWGLLPFIEYEHKDLSKVDVNSFNYRVGDIVTFTGNKHYTNSNSTHGKVCRPGKAKVTAVARAVTSCKHPVHLVAVQGGGSNVYGWVDTAFITQESVVLAVGSKVKVSPNSKTYTGGNLAPFVYKTIYDVIDIQDDRVIIGLDKRITAAVNKKDLTVV